MVVNSSSNNRRVKQRQNRREKNFTENRNKGRDSKHSDDREDILIFEDERKPSKSHTDEDDRGVIFTTKVAKTREVQVGVVANSKFARSSVSAPGRVTVAHEMFRKPKTQSWPAYKVGLNKSMSASPNVMVTSRLENRACNSDVSAELRELLVDFLHFDSVVVRYCGSMTQRKRFSFVKNLHTDLKGDLKSCFVVPDAKHGFGAVVFCYRYQFYPLSSKGLRDGWRELFHAERVHALGERSAVPVPIEGIHQSFTESFQMMGDIATVLGASAFVTVRDFVRDNYVSLADWALFCWKYTMVKPEKRLYWVTATGLQMLLHRYHSKFAENSVFTRDLALFVSYLVAVPGVVALLEWMAAKQDDIPVIFGTEGQSFGLAEFTAFFSSVPSVVSSSLSLGTVANAVMMLGGSFVMWANLKPGSEGFSLASVSKALFSRMYNLPKIETVNDAVANIVQYMPVVVAAVSAAVALGDWSNFFSDKTELGTQVVEIIAAGAYMKTGTFPNAYYDSVVDYSRALDKVCRLYKPLTERGASANSPGMRSTDLPVVMRNWQALLELKRVVATALSGSLKRAPFAISYYGTTGIGKSTINEQTTRFYMKHVHDVNVLPEEIHSYQLADPFASGFTNSKRVVTLDDMGMAKGAVGMTRSNPGVAVIQLINNVNVAMNMASIEEKGTVFSTVDLVNATSNDPMLGLAECMAYPLAALRRFAIHVHLDLRDEFKLQGSQVLDPAKIPDSPVLSIWNIKVRQAVSAAPNTAEADMRVRFVTPPDWVDTTDYSAFLRYVVQKGRQHIIAQNALLVKAKDMNILSMTDAEIAAACDPLYARPVGVPVRAEGVEAPAVNGQGVAQPLGIIDRVRAYFLGAREVVVPVAEGLDLVPARVEAGVLAFQDDDVAEAARRAAYFIDLNAAVPLPNAMDDVSSSGSDSEDDIPDLANGGWGEIKEEDEPVVVAAEVEMFSRRAAAADGFPRLFFPSAQGLMSTRPPTNFLTTCERKLESIQDAVVDFTEKIPTYCNYVVRYSVLLMRERKSPEIMFDGFSHYHYIALFCLYTWLSAFVGTILAMLLVCVPLYVVRVLNNARYTRVRAVFVVSAAFVTVVATMGYLLCRVCVSPQGAAEFEQRNSQPETIQITPSSLSVPLKNAVTKTFKQLNDSVRVKTKMAIISVGSRKVYTNLFPIKASFYITNSHTMRRIVPTDGDAVVQITMHALKSRVSQTFSVTRHAFYYDPDPESDVCFVHFAGPSEIDVVDSFIPDCWLNSFVTGNVKVPMIEAQLNILRVDDEVKAGTQTCLGAGALLTCRLGGQPHRMVVNFVGSSNTDVILMKSSLVKTVPGDCGSPAVASIRVGNGQVPVLLGIHAGLARCAGGEMVAIAPVSVEKCKRAMAFLTACSGTVQSAPERLFAQPLSLKLSATAVHPGLGLVPGVSQGGVSSRGVLMIQSGARAGVNERSENTFRSNLHVTAFSFNENPVVLRVLGVASHCIPGRDMWIDRVRIRDVTEPTSLRHFVRVIDTMRKKGVEPGSGPLLSAASEDFKSTCLITLERVGFPSRPATLLESINGYTMKALGVDTEVVVAAMPTDTAIGFGHVGPKSSVLQVLCSVDCSVPGCEKPHPLSVDGIRRERTVNYTLNRELIAELQDLIEALRSGRVGLFTFNSALKDETIALGKTKVRVFYGGMFVVNILLRMYLIPFFAAMQGQREYECQIGIDPYSLKWHEMENFLDEFDVHTRLGGDYAGFDMSVHRVLLASVFSVLIDLAVCADWSAEDLQMVEAICRNLEVSNVVMLGQVIEVEGSVMSGISITTPLNSAVNSLIHRVAFYELNEGLRERAGIVRHGCTNFTRSVRIRTYGDDVQGTTHHVLGALRMSNHNVQRAAARFGMTFGHVNKTGELPPFYPVSEMSFLKCSSVTLPDLYAPDGALRKIGMIEKASVRKCIAFERNSTVSARVSTFQSALRLFFPHAVLGGAQGVVDYADLRLEFIKVVGEVHACEFPLLDEHRDLLRDRSFNEFADCVGIMSE